MDGYDKYLSKAIKVEQAGSVYPTTIQPASIDNNQLRNISITNDKIALGAVTADSIASQTITANNIASGTITATNISAGAITATQLATGAVTATKVASDAIVAGKIAAGAINASNIIVDGIITADKLTVTNLSSINSDLGTITAGSISGAFITLPYGSISATGALRWANNNNKIWVDDNGYMGLQSSGRRIYFYNSTTLYALFQSGAQASFYSGVASYGNLNVYGDARTTGYLRVGTSSTDYLRVDGYSTMYGIVYMNNYSIRDIGAITFNKQEITSNNQLFVRTDKKLVFRDEDGTDHVLS